MKAYLLVFDRDQISHKEMLRTVDRMPSVKNWHALFGNTICLASDESAKGLARHLNSLLPDASYVITAVEPEQKGGRMPRSVLSFLNEPHSVHAEAN